MKIVLAYPIWAAGPEMVEWFMAGIEQSFDPDSTSLAFYLDEARPGAQDWINEAARKHARQFKRVVGMSEQSVRDLACHNWFIKHFMTETDADALIVAQDDIRFQSFTVARNLARVLDEYGNGVGYVGMREGYGKHYHKICGSPFDAKHAKAMELRPGVFQEALMVNPGPLVYVRSTVAKIGDLDSAYRDWYWWDDYSLRASHNKLTNVVLSIDALHQKFGSVRASSVAGDADGWAPKDLVLLNSRWSPHFGGNVI